MSQYRNSSLEKNDTSQKPRQERVEPSEVSVLVVDDEEPLRNLLRASLKKAGYDVMVASNGNDALELFARNRLDLVLLDIVMPGMSGFDTCIELRKRSDVPVVMLTALNRPDDIVHGFGIGADDYITKPFTFREVEVRIQAILRRISWAYEQSSHNVIAIDEIVLNDELHEVTVCNEPIHLTPIEYQLLRYLMSAADRPISKRELFKNVWGYDLTGGTNLVEVAIRRLRSKIEDDPSSPVYLLTVHGTGYKFNTQHK